MLRIELTKVDKLEYKIDFKLFFLSKTACANTNLLEQKKRKVVRAKHSLRFSSIMNTI